MRKAPQHAYEALTPRQRAYLQGKYQRAPFGAARGTLSMPEVPKGLQRNRRASVIQPPAQSPNRSIASSPYTEQVGRWRQL